MADESADTPASEDPPAAPDVSPDEGVLRIGGSSELLPGKPFSSEKGTGKVTIRTRWPHDSFEHGLKGVPVITAQGVEVDRSKAKELNELAEKYDTVLEEIAE